MKNLELGNYVEQYETIEELISFEDKIGEIISNTRKNINASYSLDINSYFSSIDSLVNEHKKNIKNILVPQYGNMQKKL